MFVTVDQVDDQPSARLEDAHNFKQFYVLARIYDRAILADSLAAASIGRLEGEYVWVERSWLERQGPAEDGWRTGLESMLAYATSKGWVSDDGHAIRAHVEQGWP